MVMSLLCEVKWIGILSKANMKTLSTSFPNDRKNALIRHLWIRAELLIKHRWPENQAFKNHDIELSENKPGQRKYFFFINVIPGVP